MLSSFLLSFRAGAQSEFSYEVLRLPHSERINAIGDILEDRAGIIWIATNNGLFRYDGYDYIRLHPREKNHIPEADLRQLALHHRENYLWMLGNKGQLLLLNTRTLKVKPIEIPLKKDRIASLYALPDGLLFSTLAGNIYLLKGGKIQLLSKQAYGRSFLIQFLSGNNLVLKIEASDEVVFFNMEQFTFSPGSEATGVWEENGKLYTVNRSGEIYLLGGGRQQDLTEGSDNFNQVAFNEESVWISSFGGEIFYRCLQRDRAFHAVSDYVKNELGKQKFLNTYIASDNSLWIGTSSVVYHLSPVRTGLKSVLSEKLSKDYEIGRSIRNIEQLDDQHLLIGSYSGTFKYSLPTDSLWSWNFYCDNHDPGLMRVPFMQMLKVKGQDYAVGEGYGLMNVEVENQKVFSFIPPTEVSRYILSLAPLTGDRLWLGANRGTMQFRLSDSSFLAIDSLPAILHSSEVWDILALGQGEFVFSTDSGCVFYGKNTVEIGSLGAIYALQHIEGEIFAAGERGLFRVNAQGHSEQLLKGYTFFSMLSDGQRMWLGSADGLILFYPKSGSHFRFGRREGLPMEEFNRKSALRLKDGRLVFGGINGLSIFHPDTFLQRFETGKIETASLHIWDNEGISQHYSHADIEWPREWSKVKLNLKLRDALLPNHCIVWKNSGDGWHPLAAGEISLDPELLSNNHLRIKAQFPDGSFSNELSLKIPVHPHKSWFSVIYVALILGGAFWAFRKRRTLSETPEDAGINKVDTTWWEAEWEGKTTEVLLVKPCGQVDEELLTKLYVLQDCIINNPEEQDLTAEFLASSIHTSERQLYRIFKESVGLTPRQFVNKVRLRHSLYLIFEEKYKTVNELSEAAGFKKSSYFSRLFKEEYKVSPKHYLRS